MTSIHLNYIIIIEVITHDCPFIFLYAKNIENYEKKSIVLIHFSVFFIKKKTTNEGTPI